jgi:hypothetical protein
MARNKKGKGDDFSKPSINDLVYNFEYYIDYDKDGYYVLATKAKGKKEKVIAMSQSPSQLLSHAYLTMNVKNVVYVSDVISYIIENEQNDMISDLNSEITKNLENFINNVLNKKGFINDIQDDGA